MKRPHWQNQGSEPDYRFSFANERTFLAWIRTALAILAGSILLAQFVQQLHANEYWLAISVGLAVLAIFLSAGAYGRWKSCEIAMRNSAPLPANSSIPVLAIGALLVSVLTGIYLWFI